MKARLYSAWAVVVLAYAVGWLINSDASPLSEYFLWHVTIPNWWMAVNVVPLILAILAGEGFHGFSETTFHLAFTAQWFASGYAVATLASSLRKGFRKPS